MSPCRGTLYRRLKEFISAIEDLVQAAELCEPKEEERKESSSVPKESSSVLKEVQLQLALTYNDFAVQCFSRDLYDEALLLLNKAIKEDKNLGGLYLNRGGELGLSNSLFCNRSGPDTTGWDVS